MEGLAQVLATKRELRVQLPLLFQNAQVQDHRAPRCERSGTFASWLLGQGSSCSIQLNPAGPCYLGLSSPQRPHTGHLHATVTG